MSKNQKLDSKKCHQDGLAFLGLSLSRNTFEFQKKSHPLSVTRQTQFDLDLLQDRNYHYLVSTDDNGWLAGGGEGDDAFKLPARDSAHVEIMRM